jgi:ATP-binding cassette subfamily C protein
VALIGKEKPGRWVLLVLFGLAVSVFEAIGTLLTFVLFRVITQPDRSIELPILGNLRGLMGDPPRDVYLLTVAGVVGGFFIVRSMVVVSQTYLLQRIAQTAGASIASRLANGYLRMPYAFHLTRNSSELIRNTHSAVLTVVNEAVVPTVTLFADSLLVTGLTIVLLIVAPLATLMAAVALTALIGLLLYVIHPRLKAWGQTAQETNKATVKVLQESLQGVRDIKVLSREPFFERLFAGSYRRYSRARYLRNTAVEIPQTTVETGIVLLVLALFATQVSRGDSQTDALAVLGVFAYAAIRLKPPLQRISQNLNSLKFAGAAVDHVHEDLALVEGTRVQGSETSTITPLPFERGLGLRRVGFKFPGSEEWVLRDIDLAISRGESIGVVGLTGAGKTTLMDILLGLLEPNEGGVEVDGVDIQSHVKAWQQNIGLVPQNLFLFDDTLRRNVALGISDDEIDDALLHQSIQAAQLEEFIATLPDGLDTVLGERGLRLSGGQRQRVAIARALYSQPKVIVLDEGTSALDNTTEANFMRAMNGLRGDRTLIVVAHRLTTVQHCDRIVFLERGRITDIGNYRELLDRCPPFRSLHMASSGERH